MKKLTLALLVTLFSLHSFAQSPEEHIDKFFHLYETKGFPLAFDSLTVTGQRVENMKQGQTNVKGQYLALASRLGKYSGYELLSTQKAGSCLEYRTYIVKFERQPLRFKFLFYKPENTWMFQTFTYDDKIALEFSIGTSLYMKELKKED